MLETDWLSNNRANLRRSKSTPNGDHWVCQNSRGRCLLNTWDYRDVYQIPCYDALAASTAAYSHSGRVRCVVPPS